MNSQLSRRAVVLSTDCGTEMDDQWALAHLALSPEFDLCGVVTSHAPNLPAPAAESSAKAARQVLEQLPLAQCPPVYAGSSAPLENKTSPILNSGVEFLLEVSRDFTPENRLTVLIIGAATDIASALLADPELERRIEIVAMGFQSLENGGDEWNVKNDPRAWQVILESGANIAVGDAAVCKRHLLLTGPQARDLLADCGDAGDYLAGLMVDWLRARPELAELVTGSRGTWPVWDQVTVAYLLGLTTARQLLRPVLRDDLKFAPPDETAVRNSTLQWITAIDTPRLWEDLARKLRNA